MAVTSTVKNQNPLTGTVLHLERMALFDGDGLRSVVFLKGCPLKCRWCSTPTSWQAVPQLGYNPEKCQACGSCVDICPSGAVRIAAHGNHVEIEKDACDLCYRCVAVCPSGALKQYGSRITDNRLLEILEKDEIFYFHSGGGVTLSGGEPLMQSEFCRSVLTGLRERGIHTAMETCGYAPEGNLVRVLPHVDTLFFDIKSMDPSLHISLTGKSNALILDNLRLVNQSEFPIELIVRIPVIPGINDSTANLQAAVDFCSSLHKCRQIQFLPYHRLGVESYKFLNLEYDLKAIEVPACSDIEEKIESLNLDSLSYKIGG